MARCTCDDFCDNPCPVHGLCMHAQEAHVVISTASDEETRRLERALLATRWFVRGGGIARSGPFRTQIEAVNAMRLNGGGFPSDIFVWPEVRCAVCDAYCGYVCAS